MAKTKSIVKRTERKRKFIKDKAIINFLLEHMKPVKIDFSKIKIPTFIDFLENGEKNSIFPNASNEQKIFKDIPTIGISLLNIQ